MKLSTVENYTSSGEYEWSYNIAKTIVGDITNDYIVTFTDAVFNRTHRIVCSDLDQARKLCTLVLVAIAIEGDCTICSIKDVVKWAYDIGLIVNSIEHGVAPNKLDN